mmetsp:Transcript_17386/g.26311  ORF Transcript_17386/g.26311 Transcript_17386/m.26311 type:complete len:638 (-) Transcript_17386:118-2031(-)
MIGLRHAIAASIPGSILLIASFLIINNDSFHLRSADHLYHRRLTSVAETQSNKTKIEFDQLHVAIVDEMANNLLDDTSQIWEFKDDGRPVMYTFFQPLRKQISKQDATVLAVWKHGWTQAGWNPHVLALKDVRKHPDFALIDAAVRKFGFSEYETMCYLRYFAMAAINGGGHMSDYDTVPLSMPADWYGGNGLPNDGDFTSYANFVPALLSARADEWERVGRRLIEEGAMHQHFKSGVENEVFSDMFALQKLTEKNEIITMEPFQVVQPWHLMEGGLTTLFKRGHINCELMRQHRPIPNAMHVSHATIYDAGLNVEDRGFAMAEIMQIYADSCGGPDFYYAASEANLALAAAKEAFDGIKMHDIISLPKDPKTTSEKKTSGPTLSDPALKGLYEGDQELQISRKNKVMFVHVPKAGGSTIETSKLFADKPNPASSHNRISKFVTRPGVEDFSTFAIVRHPCERVMSAFNYLKRGGSGAPSELEWSKKNIGDLTIDEWVQKKGVGEGMRTHKVQFQPMWRFLLSMRKVGSDNKFVMEVENIFCQEHFEEATAWINDKFGPDIFEKDIPKVNALEGHETCNDLKLETRKAIENFYAMDYCLFGYDKDPTKEMKTCEARKFSKEEFTDRFEKCKLSFAVS